ncbi:serine/threonine-protein kinase RIO1 [Amyelois transitella]|uniref:serine/threonine-protein kinase RIO1 n=1 Tax=Amyelois transitella TaxID=680683 RepID=UPI00067E57C0|nr:serine/threonine-protein kinase RIO1 [Amyelois transitella]
MSDGSDGQFSDYEEDLSAKVKSVRFGDLPSYREEKLANKNEENSDVEYEDEYDIDSDEYFFDYDDDGFSIQKRDSANPQPPSSKINTYQPSEKLFKKYVNKINIDKYEPKAQIVLDHSERKAENDRIKIRDKEDRATVEQVLDPRTRMILFKLLSQGYIEEINGSISMGKEANVFRATTKDGSLCALKIFMTSILPFKDRDIYVDGEFRYRHGYCKNNNYKMVCNWAHKEMRNLQRMHKAELSVPEPIVLRRHVILMSFIGTEGQCAPKLRDIDIPQSVARVLYRDCVIMMWKMFNICKLVHADLSEFNLLYHLGNLVVIDVSQSVEHDHPHAYDFLKRDCTNISKFFRKKGVATLTVRELFDFITDITITEDNMEDYLEKLSEKASLRNINDMSAQEMIEEEVFKNMYIPKRLNEVINYERDIKKAKDGEADDLMYKKIVGFNEKLGTVDTPEILQDNSVSDSESDSEEEEENKETSKFKNNARPRDESPNSKKARKKAVKEEKAEKRKTKTKKHIKKKRDKGFNRK